MEAASARTASELLARLLEEPNLLVITYVPASSKIQKQVSRTEQRVNVRIMLIFFNVKGITHNDIVSSKGTVKQYCTFQFWNVHGGVFLEKDQTMAGQVNLLS